MFKSECIHHRKEPIFSETLSDLRQKELAHYRGPLSKGKGEFGFHLCTEFNIRDDNGFIILIDSIAFGIIDTESVKP